MRADAAGGEPSDVRQPLSRLRAAGRDPAFTLLEILLALALIGLLSAGLVTGATHLLNSQPQSPEEVFWEASRTARRRALNAQQDVALSFDAKEKQFVMVSASGLQKTFPVPKAPRELTVDFLHARSGGGSVLIGGQLVDTQTLPSVTYHSDGTCTPFRVQFRTTGPARIIAIDPWTCAPVLIADSP